MEQVIDQAVGARRTDDQVKFLINFDSTVAPNCLCGSRIHFSGPSPAPDSVRYVSYHLHPCTRH